VGFVWCTKWPEVGSLLWQYLSTGLDNEVIFHFLWGTDWIPKYYSDQFVQWIPIMCLKKLTKRRMWSAKVLTSAAEPLMIMLIQTICVVKVRWRSWLGRMLSVVTVERSSKYTCLWIVPGCTCHCLCIPLMAHVCRSEATVRPTEITLSKSSITLTWDWANALRIEVALICSGRMLNYRLTRSFDNNTKN
jgi:hypothetical protein